VKLVTNLEKMNELVGSNATKEEVIKWAYMNRIHVGELALEPEFEEMYNSVENFCNSNDYADNIDDEFKLWSKFLDSEFVS
jgi:effector-binding domain-containing protein